MSRRARGPDLRRRGEHARDPAAVRGGCARGRGPGDPAGAPQRRTLRGGPRRDRRRPPPPRALQPGRCGQHPRSALAGSGGSARPDAPPCRCETLPDAVAGYLAERLDGRVTLGEVARALGYSPSHVSTLVRRSSGVRFTELRQRMRLERAVWLLERGSSVKTAALDAGFTDPAYFSRVFRRHYGMPPSRIRPRLAAAS